MNEEIPKKAKSASAQNVPYGYEPPPFLKALNRKLCQTSLLISIMAALRDWLLLAASCALGQISFSVLGGDLALPVHLLFLWPLSSLALRGLENLTHEGAHLNFDRKRPKLNDIVVDLLGARWVLLSVRVYRLGHLLWHHNRFGSLADPCRFRFDRLGLDSLPRVVPWHYLVSMLRLLPTYISDYWKQFSSKSVDLAISLSMHGFLMWLGSWLFFQQFWLYWLIYFWVPFLVYLPVHRFLAEAEKHRYEGAESVFSATFSHLGWFQRCFLHPHGDAYHLLHHLLPAIPHWKMRYAHHLLLLLDPTYKQGKFRMSIFEDPHR